MAHYDYIVIGGGSAGSAVAGRLAVDGTRRVCLVEAGGRNNNFLIKTPGFMPFLRGSSNYRYDTVAQKGLNGRIGYQPRGKGLGGSSAINAMIYIRGNAWDYDNWAEMGCDGWAYEDVLPWFKKAEGNERGADDYHGDGGPLFVSNQNHTNPTSRAFVASAEALQLRGTDDFNDAEQAGFGIYQVTQHKGERWSAARAYVEPIRDQGNIDIRTNTLVERLVIENGRVTGAVLRKGKQTETIHAGGPGGGGVILSAGAFNSPQILMTSGIGPAAHLKDHGIDVVIRQRRSRRKPAGPYRLRIHLGNRIDRPHRRQPGRHEADGRRDAGTSPPSHRHHDHTLCGSRRVLARHGRCPRARRAMAFRARAAGGSRSRKG